MKNRCCIDTRSTWHTSYGGQTVRLCFRGWRL